MISFCSGVKEAISQVLIMEWASLASFSRIPRHSSRLEDALSEANPEACREHSGNGRAGAGYTAACGHCRRNVAFRATRMERQSSASSSGVLPSGCCTNQAFVRKLRDSDGQSDRCKWDCRPCPDSRVHGHGRTKMKRVRSFYTDK